MVGFNYVTPEKMNNRLNLMCCLFIAVLSNAAFADECVKLKSMAKKHLYDNPNLEGFQCGKDIDKKLIKPSKIDGFKLIAIQPSYVTESSGTAIYQGNRVLDGTISYTDQINDGFFFHTRIDKNGVSAFSVGAGVEEDIAKLKYPINKSCKEGEELMAKAKVRVRLFQETISDGSCQGGTYPLEYDILSIGKYACKKIE